MTGARRTALPFERRVAFDGVAVAHARAGPREFAVHAHREVEVAVGFSRPAGTAVWEESWGRPVQRRTEPGYVSVLPSGQPHGGRWERPGEVLLVYLAPGDDLPAHGWIAEDVTVRRLVAPLRATLAAGARPAALAVTELATRLRAHLAGGPPPALRRPSRAALARVADHLQAHLDRPMTLGELAAVAGLSPFHLARAFRDATGLPPHRWLVEARLDRARALLLRTDLPLADVARRSGFTSQSHLGHHLRRRHGVTPGELRRLA
jgi:AraC family transcriptional regulator